MRCSIPTRSSSSAWRSTARRPARSQRFPETTPTISAGSSADWSSDCKPARPSRPLRRLTACQRDDRIGIGDSDAGYRRGDAIDSTSTGDGVISLGDRRPRRELRGLRHQRLERPAERRPHQRIGVAVAPHIVCGIDHTSGGDRAVSTGAQLARDLRCEVSLVHVMRGTHLGKSGDAIAIGAAGEHRWLQEVSREYDLAPSTRVAVLSEAAEATLEHAVREAGVDAKRRVVSSSPAEGLMRVAGETNAGLLVVGSRGRGKLGSAILGSVAIRLAAEARTPVVVLPPGAVVEGGGHYDVADIVA